MSSSKHTIETNRTQPVELASISSNSTIFHPLVQPQSENITKTPEHITTEDTDLRSSLSKQPPKKPRHWTAKEDQFLRNAIAQFGEKKWKLIASQVPGRNHTQCLQRWSKVLTPGLRKGQWDAQEDEVLFSLVLKQTKLSSRLELLEKQPRIRWGLISRHVKGRTAKQCRERWTNHLNPQIKKGSWTEEEDQQILSWYKINPRKWAWIAKKIPGRTENAVKIRWKSLNDAELKRKNRSTKGVSSKTKYNAKKMKTETSERTLPSTPTSLSGTLAMQNNLLSAFALQPGNPYSPSIQSVHSTLSPSNQQQSLQTNQLAGMQNLPVLNQQILSQYLALTQAQVKSSQQQTASAIAPVSVSQVRYSQTSDESVKYNKPSNDGIDKTKDKSPTPNKESSKIAAAPDEKEKPKGKNRSPEENSAACVLRDLQSMCSS